MTTVAISQPMLFPWPGFFEQMMLADVWLWLDDVQFSRGSFTNRIQIRHDGAIKWMTIPLVGKGSFQRIRDLVSTGDFRDSHISLMRQAYARAPFVKDAIAIMEEVYAQETLCDLLITSSEAPARWLGLGTGQRRVCTSAMNVGGVSWQRVLELVRAVAGDTYLTGHGAANYLDHESFEAAGVAVEYMAYSKTPWAQGGAVFTPYVSILDLIAHTGRGAVAYLHPAKLPWCAFLEARPSS